VLKEVANRLLSCVRINDTVSRLGGDEFMIFLPPIDEETTIKVAKRIIKEFDTPFVINFDQISLSTSICIAFYPDHASNPESLIRNADTAMYQAKKKGKNTYLIYNGGIS
jgi:diguanylate cyclase (GGDEF)-like protein